MLNKFKFGTQTFKDIFAPDLFADQRPAAYFFTKILYDLFGLNPAAFKIFILILHYINSLVFVYVVKRISKNNVIAWVAGYLYAFSIHIHITCLISSVHSIQDTLGALFLCGAIIFFLKEHLRLSAVSYLLAILSKPTTGILPFILLSFIVLNKKDKNETWLQIFKSLWVHFTIFSALIVYTIIFTHVCKTREGLKIAFFGSHVFKNIIFYIYLIPKAILSTAIGWVTFLFYILIVTALFLTFLYKKVRNFDYQNGIERYHAIFWAAWFFIALMPPSIHLESRWSYYFMYSLVPLIVIFLIFIRSAMMHFFCREAAFKAVAIGLVLISFVSGTLYLRERDKEGILSKEAMIHAAYTVKTFWEAIKEYSILPKGALIILPDDSVYWSLGCRTSAVHIWYNDQGLKIARLDTDPKVFNSSKNKKPIILVAPEDIEYCRVQLLQGKAYSVSFNKQKLIIKKTGENFVLQPRR